MFVPKSFRLACNYLPTYQQLIIPRGNPPRCLRLCSSCSDTSGLICLPDEVHTWWIDGEAHQTLEHYQSILSKEELEECLQTKNTKVKTERILARALLRTVLSKYLQPTKRNMPNSLEFERNLHGKPDLLWPHHATNGGCQLRFNVAHTNGLIGIAVALDRLVGLDVESLDRKIKGDPRILAKRYFCQSEVDYIMSLPDESSRTSNFLRLWTLKEAYVKALGRGISAAPGLHSFSFNVANNGTIFFKDSVDRLSSWEFALLQPREKHLAALCVQRDQLAPASVIKCFQVKLKDGLLVEKVTKPLIAYGSKL